MNFIAEMQILKRKNSQLEVENKRLKEALEAVIKSETSTYNQICEVLRCSEKDREKYKNKETHTCKIAKEALKGKS